MNKDDILSVLRKYRIHASKEEIADDIMKLSEAKDVCEHDNGNMNPELCVRWQSSIDGCGSCRLNRNQFRN